MINHSLDIHLFFSRTMISCLFISILHYTENWSNNFFANKGRKPLEMLSIELIIERKKCFSQNFI